MITFPTSPQNGDTHSEAGRNWTYNESSTAWEEIPNTEVSVVASETPPANPRPGMLWHDLSDGSVSFYDAPRGVWINASHPEPAASPAARVIAFCGDSITDGTGYQVYVPPVGMPRFLNRCYISYAVSILGHGFRAAVNNYAYGGYPEYDFAWAGVTAQLYATSSVNALSYSANRYPGVTMTPVEAVIASDADTAVVLIGTNDLSQTAAIVVERIEAIIAPMRDAGIAVYVCELLPRTVSNDPYLQEKIDDINALMPELCATYGATLVDWAASMKVNGLPNPDYFFVEDFGGGVTGRLHPNSAGHSAMGSYLAEVLRPTVAITHQIPAKGSPLWLNTNAWCDIDVGANGIADGFSPAYHSAASLETYEGAVWQRLACAGASDIYYYATTLSAGKISELIASQQPLRAACRYNLPAGGKVSQIMLLVSCTAPGNVVTTNPAQGRNGGSSDGDLLPHTGLLLTPEFVIPATTTAVQALVIVYCSAAGAVRLRQFGIFEVS